MNGKKLKKEAFQKLLQRQAEGKTTAAEDRQIEWILEQILSSTKDFDWEKIYESEVRDRILSRVKERISVSSTSKSRIIGRYFLRVAAVFLILLIGAVIFNMVDFKKEETPIATLSRSTNESQRAQITLPDGTLVHLNVNSTLSFPEKFSSDNRQVHLQGEAFFEVTHDSERPFVVQSSELTTQVLGTSFNISSYSGEESQVSVKTGKVRVSVTEDTEKEVFLSPSESVTLSLKSNELVTEKVHASRIAAWTAGILEFDGVPFDEVIAQLQQYYHKPLVLKNFKNMGCRITASFENKGLIFILSNLQLLADFTYKENEKGELVIEFKSC